jgi:MFS family permease
MLSGLKQAVAALRRNPSLFAVVAEGFLARLAFSVISFALPFYALALGMSLVEVGVLAALRVVIALAMKPLMGRLAGRIGVKPVYVASIAGRALVALLFILATTPAALFLVRALHGATTAARDPASAFLLMEHADERRIASAFSWYATAKTVGAALGFPLAGFVLALTGDDYALVFAFAAVISAIAFVVVLALTVEEAPRAASALTSEPQPPQPPGQWLPYAALAVAIALPASMVGGLFPLIVSAQTGLGKGEIGLIYSVSTVFLVVMGPWFGWLADHVSRNAVLAVRSVANVLSSIFYLVLPGFWGMTAARTVDDIGKAAFAPAWGAVMSSVAGTGDKRQRASRLAYLDTAESVGEALGPVIATALWQQGGLLWLFLARIAIAIVAEIYAIWLLRRRV